MKIRWTYFFAAGALSHELQEGKEESKLWKKIKKWKTFTGILPIKTNEIHYYVNLNQVKVITRETIADANK